MDKSPASASPAPSLPPLRAPSAHDPKWPAGGLLSELYEEQRDLGVKPYTPVEKTELRPPKEVDGRFAAEVAEVMARYEAGELFAAIDEAPREYGEQTVGEGELVFPAGDARRSAERRSRSRSKEQRSDWGRRLKSRSRSRSHSYRSYSPSPSNSSSRSRSRSNSRSRSRSNSRSRSGNRSRSNSRSRSRSNSRSRSGSRSRSRSRSRSHSRLSSQSRSFPRHGSRDANYTNHSYQSHDSRSFKDSRDSRYSPRQSSLDRRSIPLNVILDIGHSRY